LPPIPDSFFRTWKLIATKDDLLAQTPMALLTTTLSKLTNDTISILDWLNLFGEFASVLLSDRSTRLLSWAKLLSSAGYDWLALKALNLYLVKYLQRLDTPEAELFEASVTLLMVSSGISETLLAESTRKTAQEILSTPQNLFNAALELEKRRYSCPYLISPVFFLSFFSFFFLTEWFCLFLQQHSLGNNFPEESEYAD
jgi:hypothetical protein